MSRSIEKLLRGKMTNSDYYKDTFDSYEVNHEEVIDTIINILNNELPNEYKTTNNLEQLDILFSELKTSIIKADELNKKLIIKKIDRLSEKIDRIISERKKYMSDIEYEVSKLLSFIDKIEDIINEIENKENKKVELLRMLIDEQQIEHLEYTFRKFPGFVNLKNKDEISLFRSIVKRYLESAINLDEESVLFYSNLIALLQNQKSLNLTNIEKKLCLDDINKALNTLTYNKKQAKKHQIEIYWINSLFTLIEPDLSKDYSKSNKIGIDNMCKKYDISYGFKDEYLAEIDKIESPLKVENYPDRRVVDDYIVTIDGPDVVEIDDGISCIKLKNGNYLLGVHVASVLGHFDYYSDIVQDAINRVHSIYLPKNYQEKENDFKKVISILPFSFAADKGSLLPGDYKLTRSYYFEIDKLGNIINKKFEKTIIKSSQKTTYDEINTVLEHGSNNPKLNELVTNLSSLASILEGKYQSSLLYEEIKKKKEDPTALKVTKIGAEKLVYFSMMIVGEEVAKFFAEKDYPCLYRTLEIDPTTTKQLETVVNNVTKTYGGRVYDKLYQLISGIYPKAEYSKKGRHSGLDLDHYCHITSELRRAADIVVEHALEVCYDKEPTEEELIELENEIDRVAALINNKSKKIEWFTKEYKALTKTRRN